MSSAYAPYTTAPTTTSLRPSFAHVLRQTGMAVGDALSRLSMLLHDSREGLAAKDEQLARQMDAARHQRLGGTTATSPVASPLVVSQAADVVGRYEMHRYPTLAFIDRALGTPCRGLADSPNASDLEQRARQLVDEMDSVMNGSIDASPMNPLPAGLERMTA